jgi:hypothetical protein
LAKQGGGHICSMRRFIGRQVLFVAVGNEDKLPGWFAFG